jgi:predicted Zn-dependent protease
MSSSRGLTEPELAALCAHAERLLAAGRLDDAVLVLGSIAAVAPLRTEVWRTLGTALERLGLMPAAALVHAVATLTSGRSDPSPETLALMTAAGRQQNQEATP